MTGFDDLNLTIPLILATLIVMGSFNFMVS